MTDNEKIMKEQLRKEIEIIKESINKLNSELREKKLELNQIELGVKIGDKVEYNGSEYIIQCFKHFRPKGARIKKNGELTQNLYYINNIKREVE